MNRIFFEIFFRKFSILFFFRIFGVKTIYFFLFILDVHIMAQNFQQEVQPKSTVMFALVNQAVQ